MSKRRSLVDASLFLPLILAFYPGMPQLPSNYNFEVTKTIWRLQQKGSKTGEAHG